MGGRGGRIGQEQNVKEQEYDVDDDDEDDNNDDFDE